MERVSLFVTDPLSIHLDSRTLPYLRLGQRPIYIAINSEPVIHLQKNIIEENYIFRSTLEFGSQMLAP